MFWVVLGCLLFIVAGVGPWLAAKFMPDLDGSPFLWAGRAVAIILGIWAIASTSYVHVGDQEILVLKKHYGWSNLQGEHVIATNGEKGVQAQVVAPGFHISLLINVIYDVERVPVVHIDSNEYGYMTSATAEYTKNIWYGGSIQAMASSAITAITTNAPHQMPHRSQDDDAASSWISAAFIVPRGRYHAGKNSLRTFVIALVVWSSLMAGLLFWISAR